MTNSLCPYYDNKSIVRRLNAIYGIHINLRIKFL